MWGLRTFTKSRSAGGHITSISLWFMRPITIVFMGFINQLITFGSPTLYVYLIDYHPMMIYCWIYKDTYRDTCIYILYTHCLTYTGWWFQPLWNIWKSVGMMKFPIDGNIIQMFQTTNQTLIFHYQRVNHHYITINIPINITIKTIPSDHIMIYCWIY